MNYQGDDDNQQQSQQSDSTARDAQSIPAQPEAELTSIKEGWVPKRNVIHEVVDPYEKKG